MTAADAGALPARVAVRLAARARMAAGDRVVVSHDSVLRPPVCTGPKPEAVIHASTLAELREFDCGKVQNPQFSKQQTVPGTRIPTLMKFSHSHPKVLFGSISRRRLIPGIRNLPLLPKTLCRRFWR